MSVPYPALSIPNSEVRTLESSIVNDTYQVNIVLPVEYRDTDKTYPVVYATDGDSNIFTLAHLAGALSFGQELPPLIIVGIAHASADPAERWQCRFRDLAFTPDPEMEKKIKAYPFQLQSLPVPGAKAFLQFIREELKPFINANYRTDPNDSTFVGFSGFGGFGLYTLFHHPDTFNRYVIGSATIAWGNKIIFTYEHDYAQQHDDLPVRLFMSVGEREEIDDPLPLIEPSDQLVTNMKTLAHTLQERHYPGLQMTVHVFEDETHMSVIQATFSRGLRTVFR
jgi:predicted alpha/beta superfamily hydrolase